MFLTIMENSSEQQLKFMAEVPTEKDPEWIKVVQKNGVQHGLKYLQEKLDTWKNIPLNLAIIGNSGVGKSTFINSLRGLNADDDGGAAVGANETTTEPKVYEHPNNSNMKIWDLPGVGTINFPKKDYLEKIGFSKYDFFIIISAGRFTDDDGWLAKKIKEDGKQLYFVRSQISVDLEKDKLGHPQTHEPQSVVESIRQNVMKNLQRLDVTAKFFLIDSYERGKFDFTSLENSLIDDYPETKRQALILSMSSFSEVIIRNKAAVLKDRIRWTAMLSAAGAVVPVPGLSAAVDLSVIAKEASFYYKQLGLKEESLKKTADLFSIDEKCLLEIIQNELPYAAAFRGGQASADAIKPAISFVVKQSVTLFASLAGEGLSRFIPIVGVVICSPLSFVTTYYILKNILNKFEEIALKIAEVLCKNTV